MSEYGYIPESPAQSFGINKGIFTPNDIYDLTRDDKFTDYGQLDLIQTQTTSDGDTAVNFTSLYDYNVHFLVWNNLTSTSAETNTVFRLSNDGGSSFISSGYQYAFQFQRISSPLELKDTSSAYMGYANNLNHDVAGNGYAYFYNLLDSTKYSFNTFHGSCNSNTFESSFGSGVLPTTETHNALQLTCNTDSFTAGASVSLYGIKEYS